MNEVDIVSLDMQSSADKGRRGSRGRGSERKKKVEFALEEDDQDKSEVPVARQDSKLRTMSDFEMVNKEL